MNSKSTVQFNSWSVLILKTSLLCFLILIFLKRSCTLYHFKMLPLYFILNCEKVYPTTLQGESLSFVIHSFNCHNWLQLGFMRFNNKPTMKSWIIYHSSQYVIWKQYVFILSGLSAMKILLSMFFIKWNWICLINIHLWGYHISLSNLLNSCYFTYIACGLFQRSVQPSFSK